MPVSINPLTLQDLFYRVLNNLELAQNQLYNDELSRLMKLQCDKQRDEYLKEFKKILNESNS